MSFAVIKAGGKQYLAKVGSKLKLEKIGAKTTKLDTLLVAEENGEKVEIGRPVLSTKTEVKVLSEALDKKVTVHKYKAKTRYKRTVGHRQPYSLVQVEKI